jgi:hypothetical protein
MVVPLLLSRSLPFHYSPVIPPFNATESEILTASSNESQNEKKKKLFGRIINIYCGNEKKFMNSLMIKIFGTNGI